MTTKKKWGHTDRWLIFKRRNEWYVLAPGSSWAEWYFSTGAEALAAFAKGESAKCLDCGTVFYAEDGIVTETTVFYSKSCLESFKAGLLY